MVDDRKSLGARLREAREYLGLSQDEVARAVGLPRPSVSLIESGQRKVDTFELKRLSQLYQRPLTHFTGAVESDGAIPEAVQHLARKAARLTDADQAELIRFAEFLSAKGMAKQRAE